MLRRSILATLLVHAVSVTPFFAVKVNDVRSYRRSCVIDATSGTVRLVPIEDWRVVSAPTTP